MAHTIKTTKTAELVEAPIKPTLIQMVEQAFEYADPTSTPEWLTEIGGYAGRSFQAFLGNLCYNGLRYLEVGVFQGASLCAAALSGKSECYGIDNFKFDGSSFPIVDHLREIHNLKFKVIRGDCFDQATVDKTPDQIQVFYYDGDHDQKAQYKGITTYKDKFANEVLIIVDDWNWKAARLGFLQAMDELEVDWEVAWYKGIVSKTHPDKDTFGKVLFTALGDTIDHGDRVGWWNGVGLFVLRKQNPTEPVETKKEIEVENYGSDSSISNAGK